MEYFKIILQGILLGATLSCVVGPAVFSLIQTSINQGFRAGMHFAMGIALSDLILICLVYLGFSSLFENHQTIVILSVVGGIILLIFGTYTFTRKSNVKKSKEVELKRPFFGKSIMRGFVFNIVNPSIWFYWLVPVGIATSYGNTAQTYIFLLSMLVTIFSFDLLKCGISYKLKELMTDKIINIINKIVGCILIVIGAYLILSIFDKFEFLQKLPINNHHTELPKSTKKAEIHTRLLPIEGAYNVRDLGGYKTQSSKTVKWRKVFRSGDLNHLSEKDLKYLSEIPLITTIDFRDSAEIASAPDKTPESLKNQYFLPISTGSIIDFQKIKPKQVPTLLITGNENFVRNNQNVYKEFFAILMDEKNIPLLFHCSAGKDRAGFGAALFLSSLGVDRKTVIQDYLLTNEYLKDKYSSMIEANPTIAPLLEARREYIQAAFDVIDKEYGGMENYLIHYLNVDLGKMRALYTE